MRAFSVFTKKELMESLRTRRFVISLAVFVIFGILSPLTALLLPEILGAFEMGGVIITIPEPTAMDAWLQYFSNIGSMGMLVVIVVFSGIMAHEFSRGTLVNLLTKGLNRTTVILSKFFAASLIWTVIYLVSLGVALAYIAVFWEMDMQNAVLAFVSLWLFGELLIAVLIFGGTLTGSFGGSLGMALGVIIVLGIVSAAPAAARFNPISLAGGTVTLLNGESAVGDFMPAVIICGVAVIVLVIASIVVFGKKRV